MRHFMLPVLLLLAVPLTAAAEPTEVQGLIARLKADKEQDRADAARRLGQLGPKAKEAAPALVEALKDPLVDVRLRAAAGLARIDGKHHPQALPVLRATLKDDNADNRLQAAEALLAIDPAQERDALLVVIAQLKATDGPEQLQAV